MEVMRVIASMSVTAAPDVMDVIDVMRRKDVTDVLVCVCVCYWCIGVCLRVLLMHWCVSACVTDALVCVCWCSAGCEGLEEQQESDHHCADRGGKLHDHLLITLMLHLITLIIIHTLLRMFSYSAEMWRLPSKQSKTVTLTMGWLSGWLMDRATL